MRNGSRPEQYAADAPHRRRRVGTTRSVTAAVLAVLYGVPSVADEPTLQEIIVTATRRAASAQDIPLSITAISGDTLDQAGIQDLSALARSLAGFNFVDKGPFGGASGSSLIIRGLNAEALVFQPGLGTPVVPAVATYVDDTPLFVHLRLQDLDHVEILRGPQGTLYGSGSLGGTIRFIQNAPDPTAFSAKAEAGVSKTDHAHAINDDVNATINLPVSPTIAVRLNASFTNEAGFINEPGLYPVDASGVPIAAHSGQLMSPAVIYSKDGVNSYGYRSARIATLWKPNDDFHAQLSYYYQKSTANGFPAVTPNVYGASALSFADVSPDTATDRVDLAALTLEYDLGFATLTSSSSWAHHNNATVSDLTHLYEGFSFYPSFYGANPRALVIGRDQLDDTPWTEEIRFVSKTHGTFDWVAGLFFRKEQTNIQEHEYYPGYNDYFNACAPVYGVSNGDGVTPSQCGVGEYGPSNNVGNVNGISLVKDQTYIGDFQTSFKDLALFGELTAHLSDAWSVTGGARAFKQTVSQSQQTGLLFDGPAFIANNSLSAEWRRASWKFNTAYKIDNSNQVYATWSQGFRRGGVNALPPTEPAANYVTPSALFKVQPDTADNYEVGVKGTLWNRIRYSAAIFDINWHNIQEGAQLTPFVYPGAVNLGDGYSRGLETELLANITEHVSAQLGYTYDETKLTSISAEALAGLSVPPPAAGGPLPGTPKNSLALGFEYGHVGFAGGELRYAINGHYQGPVLSAVSATIPRVGGYTTLGTRASFARSSWVTTVYVDNLTNVLGINTYSDPYNYGNRNYFAVISRPRTIGVTIAYSFKAL